MHEGMLSNWSEGIFGDGMMGDGFSLEDGFFDRWWRRGAARCWSVRGEDVVGDLG